MSSAIPGWQQSATLTPYLANNTINNGAAIALQIEDEDVVTEILEDEITNAASGGGYEAIQAITKSSYRFTMVLDSSDAASLIDITQMQGKLWSQMQIKYSSVAANPITVTGKGFIKNLRRRGSVKKAWRVEGEFQVNGYWTYGGANTGGVTT